MEILPSECKIILSLNEKETAEKLFNHFNCMIDSELDKDIKQMYRIIRSDVDKYLQKRYRRY